MRTGKMCSLILFIGTTILACSVGQAQIKTIEVTRVVRESYPIEVEVTRLVPKHKVVTVEVTHIVRQTVVVPPPPTPAANFQITIGIALIVPRTSHTATRLQDNRILLVGGGDGGDVQLSEVEIFDPQSGSLTQAVFLHTPRHGHTATLLPDNRVLVVGGYNAAQQWLADAEVYDPATNTWAVIPPIYPHGVQHTTSLLKNGRVLVVGGCIGSGICTHRVEIFDPRTNTWLEAPPLEVDRASHTATLLDDGRVLIVGGGSTAGSLVGGDALVYDPQWNNWTPTGPMILPVAQAAAIKLSDRRVLVAGGYPPSENPQISAQVQIYDPASNTWTAAASLSQPRLAFLLEALPDGQVLAIGGAHEYDYPYSRPWTEASFVHLIERYDPLADRWSLAGELPQPLAYAASAWLPDGRLWLTGGNAARGAWADTWLVSPLPVQP